MKNLLILGSLPNTSENYQKYETIIAISKKYFQNISSPIDTKKFIGTDKERFERAIQKVTEADLIIGELSLSSTGQGIEIGIAHTLNKSIIIVAKEGSKVSGLIEGCSNIKQIVYYSNYQDLEKKLLLLLK